MKSISSDNLPVNLSALEAKYSAGEVVDMVSLLNKKIINKEAGKLPKVKILGEGTLTKKLTVQGIPVSKGAKEAIEKLGGKVV
jgi:large subunit ribosomal protein L15